LLRNICITKSCKKNNLLFPEVPECLYTKLLFQQPFCTTSFPFSLLVSLQVELKGGRLLKQVLVRVQEHKDACVASRETLMPCVNNELSSVLDCNKENVTEFLFTLRVSKCADHGSKFIPGRGDKHTGCAPVSRSLEVCVIFESRRRHKQPYASCNFAQPLILKVFLYFLPTSCCFPRIY